MTKVLDRYAVQNDADVRRRAREICSLSAKSKCMDQEGCAPKDRCTPENCYIWELIEMGRVGHPE